MANKALNLLNMSKKIFITCYTFTCVLIVHISGNEQKSEELFPEDVRLYGYETLVDATHNFGLEKRIFYGSFGEVYKGILSKGQEVAVKLFSDSDNVGIFEFRNEVEVMSKLQHRNVISLLGCCVNKRSQKMLIYEYVPNGGSLDSYISDSKKRVLLDWNRRKIIIEGIARGLLFLHQDSRLNIVHGDLVLSNIFLDEELNPKILGFNTKLQGSGRIQRNKFVEILGHIAPELHAQKGISSEKSDVYSYGVLLLEIISGKRYGDLLGNGSNYPYLIGWAWELWTEKETIKLVDPAILYTDIGTEILRRYIHVGLLCLQQSANDRPDMSTLLSMLKNEVAELPRLRLQSLQICEKGKGLSSS